jgi:hypothetical protein
MVDLRVFIVLLPAKSGCGSYKHIVDLIPCLCKKAGWAELNRLDG